jgi:hypothetical protein
MEAKQQKMEQALVQQEIDNMMANAIKTKSAPAKKIVRHNSMKVDMVKRR